MAQNLHILSALRPRLLSWLREEEGQKMFAKMVTWLTPLTARPIRSRNVRLVQSDALPAIPAEQLALDIAACDALGTQLVPLLMPFQNHLALHLNQPCQIHLDIAGERHGNRSDAALLTNAIDKFKRDHGDHTSALLSLSGGQSIYLRQHVLEDGETLYWGLTLSGERLARHQLDHLTQPLHEALHCGLGVQRAWQQRCRLALTQERVRQAAEVHDTLAQVLGFLRMQTARLAGTCQRESLSALIPLSRSLEQQAHCAYRQARELIRSARVSSQCRDLNHAIEAAVAEFEPQSPQVFEIDLRASTSDMDEHNGTQLLFIVREALSNAVRHSRASHIRIQSRATPHATLQLRIEDNGQGIHRSPARSDSFGLQIMHERAARIGATLMVGERPGGGTRIDISLDLRA